MGAPAWRVNESQNTVLNDPTTVRFAPSVHPMSAPAAIRNPVMFKNGLRNISRRKSQTALIVIGLMLST
jgi:hypothetical protein